MRPLKDDLEVQGKSEINPAQLGGGKKREGSENKPSLVSIAKKREKTGGRPHPVDSGDSIRSQREGKKKTLVSRGSP